MEQAAPAQNRYAKLGAAGSARLYADVEASRAVRMSTGIDEFDRVLGGGVVPGSLVLLGGEPGNPREHRGGGATHHSQA